MRKSQKARHRRAPKRTPIQRAEIAKSEAAAPKHQRKAGGVARGKRSQPRADKARRGKPARRSAYSDGGDVSIPRLPQVYKQGLDINNSTSRASPLGSPAARLARAWRKAGLPAPPAALNSAPGTPPNLRTQMLQADEDDDEAS
jgi:hypothetical protein